MSKRILLTGANGFVGSHILSQLLTSGHSVRAIVRSQSKALKIAADFPIYSLPQLDFGIVPDITTPGAFNEAVKSTPPFDILIHTASPFLYGAVSDNSQFLDPAIKGTLEVLKAVKEFAPSVKRVVLTSSCAAVINFSVPFTSDPRKVYTEEDWNPTTREGALSGTPNNAYQASKKFAELSGSAPLLVSPYEEVLIR
jgi:nucleoside-diphosphate-sugar epimerase